MNAGYAAGMAAIALAIMFAWKLTTRDVDFCRAVFRGLVAGRPSVAQRIDWEHLQAVGADVGKEYRLFRLEKDRVNYRANFITAFSRAFKLTGGTFGGFVKWQVVDRQPETVTIAAEYPLRSKTLLFVIPARGERKLLAVRWSDQSAPAVTRDGPGPEPAAATVQAPVTENKETKETCEGCGA